MTTPDDQIERTPGSPFRVLIYIVVVVMAYNFIALFL